MNSDFPGELWCSSCQALKEANAKMTTERAAETLFVTKLKAKLFYTDKMVMECTALRKDLDATTESYNTLKRTEAECRALLNKQQSQLEMVEQQRNVALSEVEKLRKEVTRFQRRQEKNQEQLEQSKGQIQALQMEQSQASIAYQETDQKLRTRNDEIKELRANNKKLEIQMNRLKDEVATCKRSLYDIKKENTTFERENVSLRKKLEKFEKKASVNFLPALRKPRASVPSPHNPPSWEISPRTPPVAPSTFSCPLVPSSSLSSSLPWYHHEWSRSMDQTVESTGMSGAGLSDVVDLDAVMRWGDVFTLISPMPTDSQTDDEEEMDNISNASINECAALLEAELMNNDPHAVVDREINDSNSQNVIEKNYSDLGAVPEKSGPDLEAVLEKSDPNLEAEPKKTWSSLMMDQVRSVDCNLGAELKKDMPNFNNGEIEKNEKLPLLLERNKSDSVNGVEENKHSELSTIDNSVLQTTESSVPGKTANGKCDTVDSSYYGYYKSEVMVATIEHEHIGSAHDTCEGSGLILPGDSSIITEDDTTICDPEAIMTIDSNAIRAPGGAVIATVDCNVIIDTLTTRDTFTSDGCTAAHGDDNNTVHKTLTKDYYTVGYQSTADLNHVTEFVAPQVCENLYNTDHNYLRKDLKLSSVEFKEMTVPESLILNKSTVTNSTFSDSTVAPLPVSDSTFANSTVAHSSVAPEWLQQASFAISQPSVLKPSVTQLCFTQPVSEVSVVQSSHIQSSITESPIAKPSALPSSSPNLLVVQSQTTVSPFLQRCLNLPAFKNASSSRTGSRKIRGIEKNKNASHKNDAARNEENNLHIADKTLHAVVDITVSERTTSHQREVVSYEDFDFFCNTNRPAQLAVIDKFVVNDNVTVSTVQNLSVIEPTESSNVCGNEQNIDNQSMDSSNIQPCPTKIVQDATKAVVYDTAALSGTQLVPSEAAKCLASADIEHSCLKSTITETRELSEMGTELKSTIINDTKVSTSHAEQKPLKSGTIIKNDKFLLEDDHTTETHGLSLQSILDLRVADATNLTLSLPILDPSVTVLAGNLTSVTMNESCSQADSINSVNPIDAENNACGTCHEEDTVSVAAAKEIAVRIDNLGSQDDLPNSVTSSNDLCDGDSTCGVTHEMNSLDVGMNQSDYHSAAHRMHDVINKADTTNHATNLSAGDGTFTASHEISVISGTTTNRPFFNKPSDDLAADCLTHNIASGDQKFQGGVGYCCADDFLCSVLNFGTMPALLSPLGLDLSDDEEFVQHQGAAKELTELSMDIMPQISQCTQSFVGEIVARKTLIAASQTGKLKHELKSNDVCASASWATMHNPRNESSKPTRKSYDVIVTTPVEHTSTVQNFIGTQQANTTQQVNPVQQASMQPASIAQPTTVNVHPPSASSTVVPTRPVRLNTTMALQKALPVHATVANAGRGKRKAALLELHELPADMCYKKRSRVSHVPTESSKNAIEVVQLGETKNTVSSCQVPMVTNETANIAVTTSPPAAAAKVTPPKNTRTVKSSARSATTASVLKVSAKAKTSTPAAKVSTVVNISALAAAAGENSVAFRSIATGAISAAAATTAKVSTGPNTGPAQYPIPDSGLSASTAAAATTAGGSRVATNVATRATTSVAAALISSTSVAARNTSAVAESLRNVDRVLHVVLQSALTSDNNYTCVEVAVQLAGHRPQVEQLAELFIRACVGCTEDIKELIYERCLGGYFPDFRPWLTDLELRLVNIIIQCSRLHPGLVELFLQRAALIFSNEKPPRVCQWTGHSSLCRVVTALCRIKGDLFRVRALVIDAVKCKYFGFFAIILQVAAVWPQALRCRQDEARLPLVEQTRIRLANEPVLSVIEFIVCGNTKWLNGKQQHKKVRFCLEKLLGWGGTGAVVDCRQMAAGLLETLRRTTLLPQQSTDKIWNVELSLELLGLNEGWEWINNVLVRDFLWPELAAWAMSTVDTPFIKHIIMLLGQVVSHFPQTGQRYTDKILTTLTTLISTPTVSAVMQRASLRSVLMLANFHPELVAVTAIDWVKGHPDPDLSTIDPITSSLFNRFLDTYAPKLQSVAQYCTTLLSHPPC